MTLPNESNASRLVCTCASTPPTMPTARDVHLFPCPVAFYELVCRQERAAQALLDTMPKTPKPKDNHVPRAIIGADLMAWRVMRLVMEQGEGTA